MFTECPSCNTYFRVAPEQLKAAGGKVRCGQCGTVFNALASLTDTLPGVPAEPPGQNTAEEFTAPPSQPSTPAEEAQSDFGSVQVPGMVEEAEAPPEEMDFSADDASLDHLFAEDEEDEAPAADLASEPFGADQAPSETNPPVEAWDEQEEPVGEVELSEAGGFPDPLSDQPPSATMDPLAQMAAEDGEEEAPPGSKFSADDYVLEELKEDRPAERSGAVTAFRALLIVLLLGVLAAQFAYFKRDQLSQYAALRPSLEKMCDVVSHYFPCDIPPLRDLTAIQLVERDVRSHPDQSNALQITATLVNEATFVQPYPSMRVSFTDMNNEAVAERVFEPKEYLGEDIDLAGGMEPGVPVRVKLSIVDPGRDAVNFEFHFQ